MTTTVTTPQSNAVDDSKLHAFMGKMVGDMASLNQGLISGEIDLYLTGGTYSVSPARADGHPEMRSITPLKGPIDGKGGVAWIEITSTVANPQLSPLAPQFLEYVQDPEIAHVVAFAEGTFNPVAQMPLDTYMVAFPEILAVEEDA